MEKKKNNLCKLIIAVAAMAALASQSVALASACGDVDRFICDLRHCCLPDHEHHDNTATDLS